MEEKFKEPKQVVKELKELLKSPDDPININGTYFTKENIRKTIHINQYFIDNPL
tara:strand:+ start:167 stop:328 length:162 start_codon:yes stop_codon:yes gene_type:complete